MIPLRIVSRLSRLVAAAAPALGLAFGLVPAGLAQNAGPPAPLSVTIHADHYGAGGQVFGELDALEAWIRPMRPQAIRLQACDGAAGRLLAAAHRFRHVRLDLQVLADGPPACVPGAAARGVQVMHETRPPPGAAEDEAVARYWRNLMP